MSTVTLNDHLEPFDAVEAADGVTVAGIDAFADVDTTDPSAPVARAARQGRDREAEEDVEDELSLDPGELALADSLSLFLREIGRYPLLTAAEEVALAKRVERGDPAAKERMITSNLRLVVATRSATGVTVCRSAT